MTRFALASLALLAGCVTGAAGMSSVAPQAGHRSTRLPDVERAQCLAGGGRIGIAGLGGREMCVRRLSDAGRSCTGSEQCQGLCEYRGEGEPASGAGPVAGQCQAEAYPFGCRQRVEGGVVQPAICVD